MGIIKAFYGLNKYKDEESVYDVLSYAIGSLYFCEAITGNIQNNSGDIQAIAEQFKEVQSLRMDMDHKAKLHHFVLSVVADNMSDGAIRDLMRVVKDYFIKRRFQVIVVKHYASKGLIYNPHLHVIVNHCSLNGKLFYGNDQSYYELKNYLIRVTHHKWKFVYAQEKDYE